MRNKMTVGILFGGKSAEHEISLLSAQNIVQSIDSEKYVSALIGIDKQGVWFLLDQASYLLYSDDPKRIALNTEHGRRVVLAPGGNGALTLLDTGTTAVTLDVAFPIIHGPFGEDGTLQGLLKLANVPFVGAGVLGSAVGMDKDVMKRLLRDAGVPIGKFIAAKEKNTPSFEECREKLGLPLFIKPANLGSSVGVSKVHDAESFERAITEAFKYDTKILIEEYLKGREIECAILGADEPIASSLGEIIPTHDFYSYDAKYIDEHGATTQIPAQLPADITEAIQEISRQTFIILSCEGFGRVDFFLTEKGEIYVNEINTIPGFTQISMYPKLWEASGISCSELIDRLILLACQRFERERQVISKK